MIHCFYYDESEHSRIINLSTITGETYYDGFLAAIIGWRSDHETAFEQSYHAFSLMSRLSFRCSIRSSLKKWQT